MVEIKKLYNVAMSACCDFNDADPERMGMAFAKETDGIWDAVIASHAYIIKVRNVEEPQGPFLSYLENKYVPYKYPTPIEPILKIVDEAPNSAVIAQIKNCELQNHLDYIYCHEQEIRARANMVESTGNKSRFIFRPCRKYLDKSNKEVQCFLTPTIDGRIVGRVGNYTLNIIANPAIPVEQLDFKSVYKCALIKTTDGILLNPIEKYGDIMMGYMDSPGLYLRDLASDVTTKLATTLMLDKVDGDPANMEEYHMRVKMFRDVVNVMKCIDPNAPITIFFPPKHEEPLTLTCGDNNAEVVIKAMGLDPTMDRQRG